MERLTRSDERTPGIVELMATDDPCTDICDQICGNCDGGCPINEAYKRLKTYEDAEEQGRLVRLPLPVGATIYHEGDKDYPLKIADVGILISAVEEEDWITLEEFEHDFENEIASAREAAEAALLEGER